SAGEAGSKPLKELLQPCSDRDGRGPTEEFLRFENIRYINLLISRAPAGPVKLRRDIQSFPNPVQQLKQREGAFRAAAGIENLAANASDPAQRRIVKPHQVIDEKHVPHLLAVAVNSNAPAGKRRDDEPRDPSLILHAVLPRAVDAGLAEDDGVESVDPGIITHILVRRALGTSVRGMKIKRRRFRYAGFRMLQAIASCSFTEAHPLHPAVNFVCRGEKDGGFWAKPPHSLEDVECPKRVGLEIRARIEDGSRDGRLARHMEHQIEAAIALENAF